MCPACGAAQSLGELAGALAREIFGSEGLSLAHCLETRPALCAGLRLLALDPPPALDALLGTLPGYQRVSVLATGVPGRTNQDGWLCQDAGCLAFPDGSFDVVLSHDVFEHIDDPWGAFAEAGRVLRAGGKHIFTVPLHEHSATRARAARDPHGLLHHHLPEVFRGGEPGGSGLFVYTDFGDDLPGELSRRGLPTTLARQMLFAASAPSWTLETEDDYRRYAFMRSRGALSRFFVYNSHVFVTEQPHEASAPQRFRVRFSAGVSAFQELAAERLAALLHPAPRIQHVRGECV